MNSVLDIRMTLSSKGFTLNQLEHELVGVLANGLLEIQFAHGSKYVKPVQMETRFSIELIEGSITYVLEYYTNTDSLEERSFQRALLKVKVEEIHRQTEKAIFLCLDEIKK